MPDLAARIVVIGAGAAGLTAAEMLKRQGYSNVIVLERSNRAGGKCYSLDHEERPYELGAGIVAANNHTVLGLAKEFNVPVEQVQFGKNIFLDADTGERIPEKTILRKLSTLRQLLFRYIRLVKKYRATAQPGLQQLDPALCVPFERWAAQHNIPLVADELAPFFTGFGYGYFSDVPAAYVLKYYSWDMLKTFAQRKLYKFPQGIQTLWTTIAEHHDVRYNTVIKDIRRDTSVTITTTTEQIECDRLIIAAPLDEALTYLDATETERHLFSKIQYCDYRTYAIWIDNFPAMNGYIPGNYRSDRPGQPVFWYKRYSDSNLYTFYALGDWKMTDDTILKNIQDVVEKLGGTVQSVHTIEHWKYFPHVNTEDMSGGFFDALEHMQGVRHTYYAGEVMNFSTVGLSAEYSEDLINRFF